MHRLTFFTKPDCSLCRGALYVIERVRARIPFELVSVDITAHENERWFEAYRHDIPIVHLNGKEIFRHHIDERRLHKLLVDANDAASSASMHDDPSSP